MFSTRIGGLYFFFCIFFMLGSFRKKRKQKLKTKKKNLNRKTKTKNQRNEQKSEIVKRFNFGIKFIWFVETVFDVMKQGVISFLFIIFNKIKKKKK